MPTWRKIKTAPKDEPVLCWQAGAEAPYVAAFTDRQWRTCEQFVPPVCQPTHWIPLPASPCPPDRCGSR